MLPAGRQGCSEFPEITGQEQLRISFAKAVPFTTMVIFLLHEIFYENNCLSSHASLQFVIVNRPTPQGPVDGGRYC
jgi:hypothetical protein